MSQVQMILDVAQRRQAFLRSQYDQLKGEKDEYGKEVERLTAMVERTRRELVGYLLPDVEDEDLARLERRLSYPGLLPIKRAFEQRLAAEEDRRAAMEREPDIINYEFHLAQVTDELAGIEDAYQSVKADLERWQANPWYQELVKTGFFSDKVRPGLLQRLWHWRAVSFLISDLNRLHGLDLANPDQVRQRHATMISQAEPIMELHQNLTRRQEELKATKAEFDRLTAAPERLFQEMYDALGRALGDHIESAPAETFFGIAAEDASLAVFLKRMTGLRKQIQYLRELTVTRIDSLMQSLEQELYKLERKIKKVMRKGACLSTTEIRDLKILGEEKWQKRQAKLERMRVQISHFDRYERGSFAQDFLWWSLLTKDAPGQDIYEVRSFQASHPGWTVSSYTDPWEGHNERAMDQAASSLAADMAMGGQGEHLTDPS